MLTIQTIENEILAHLNSIATGGDPTLRYGQLATRLGARNHLRGSQSILNGIRHKYQTAKPRPLPDITWILKSKATGYPSQIHDKIIRRRSELTEQDRKNARIGLQEVIDAFCPGAHNPY